MALRDIFKKKPKEKPTEKVKKPETKPIIAKSEKRVGFAYQALKSPHITEKATDLAEQNQYVFKVEPKTNKIEIKKAVENLYGVDVISVGVINVPRKKRRLGRIMGWRKGYKKAIVRVKEGQKIEIMPR